MSSEIYAHLQKILYFNGLTEENLNPVIGASKVIAYKKGSMIFCQGDEAKAYYLVLRGWVTVVRENNQAEQSVLHVFREGDSFAEPAALTIGHYPASAVAATNCELLEIKSSAIRKMIQQQPDIAMRMIVRLSAQLNTLVNEFEQYKTTKVEQRLAIFLAELFAQNSGQNPVELPFSKATLATYLRIQPSTLSRAFNQLAMHGVRTDRSGQIIIDDIAQLQARINNPD